MWGSYAVASTLTVGGKYGVSRDRILAYYEEWRSRIARGLGVRIPMEYAVLARGGTRGGGERRLHIHSTIAVAERDDTTLRVMRDAWLATTAVADLESTHPAVIKWADNIRGWVHYSMAQRDPDATDRRSALGGQYGSGVVEVFMYGPDGAWAAVGEACASRAAPRARRSAGPHPGRPVRESTYARRFLAEMRTRGTTLADQIIRLARQRGQFSIKTLKRVKLLLGIRSARCGKSRLWRWIWS